MNARNFLMARNVTLNAAFYFFYVAHKTVQNPTDT